jgi:hypothetical protein
MIFRFVGIVVSLLLILSACHTSAPCFNKNMEQTVMKWGDYNPDNKTYDGYKLMPTGLLQKYFRDTSGVEISKNITYISHEDVCKILKYCYWVMKKVQTCYEPGDNLKYLTFINDTYNTRWHAVWNEDFNTGSNKYLKIVFDSLNTVIRRIDNN